MQVSNEENDDRCLKKMGAYRDMTIITKQSLRNLSGFSVQIYIKVPVKA
jgi:hypothetical protein